MGPISVWANFHALVDLIIPPVQMGAAQWYPIYGAVQLGIDQYVMRELDHSQFIPLAGGPAGPPLSWTTSQLLDLGAEQLILMMSDNSPTHLPPMIQDGRFAALSPQGRLMTLNLLDQAYIPLNLLPPPFQNDAGMVRTMVDSLHQLTLFGYFSEWTGYGATRLWPPAHRRLSDFPYAWRSAGYPGPSYGYRDFRGFLLKYPHVRK